MKSFFAGFIAILMLGLVFLAFRGKLTTSTVAPSPTPSGTPSNWDMAPDTTPDSTPKPASTPTPTTKPTLTTKGGQVLGTTPATTKTITTTTTTKVTHLTLLESSDCLLDATTYLRDITSPLAIKYSLKDNYSAKVTIWKTNGETVIPQTLIRGTGLLKEITSKDDLKFQIVSADCEETTDTWLRLTADK